MISKDARPLTRSMREASRKFAIKKSPANNFIDSVMSTDVFSNQAWFAVEPKNASRVNSASAGEVALVLTQERWEARAMFRDECGCLGPTQSTGNSAGSRRYSLSRRYRSLMKSFRNAALS